MANDRLGVTVMELFVYNPYRIIGIPVDANQEKIDEVYGSLRVMCENETIATYKSAFDFPSLPPFQRNLESLANAYTKLSGDIYRCFAFSESLYAVNLSRADISIQISNIDSYDKFLSCYMWLIINDTNISLKNLWFKIAKHIDMLICSNPEDWEELFDHRFPKDVYKNDMNSIKGFYNTFCEVILLPLKELVKGSLECMTASEILSNALFDGDFAAFMTQVENSEKIDRKKSKKAHGMLAVSSVGLVDEELERQNHVEEPEEDTVDLLEGVSDEANIYTDALNQMIKSNRARNQEIKSVDTSKVFGSGNLGKEEDVELTMSSVNSRVYDESKLTSPYELYMSGNKEMKVDISDMLNPQLKVTTRGAAQMRDSFSGAEEYTKENQAKRAHKKNMFLIKLTIFLIVVVACASLGYVFKQEIIDFVKGIIDKFI